MVVAVVAAAVAPAAIPEPEQEGRVGGEMPHVPWLLLLPLLLLLPPPLPSRPPLLPLILLRQSGTPLPLLLLLLPAQWVSL